jgi:copper chaperone CopZ
MKRTVLIFSLMLSALFVTESFANTDGGKKEIKEVTLSCKMDCMNCQNAVEKQLSFTKGVKSVKANHETDLITITYLSNKTNPELIIESLGEINYKASIYNPKGKTENKKGCNTPCSTPCGK